MESHTKAFFFAAATLLGLVNCFQWQTVPDPVTYACVGNDIKQHWSFTTTPNETVYSTAWAFMNTSLIGYKSGFFLHNPSYGNRLDHQGNAYILKDVKANNSGTYTMNVTVTEQGNWSLYRHSVLVHVSDELMLQNGTLDIKQDPVAVWNNATRDWNIRLTCGTFSYGVDPPIDVSWTTPSGDSRNSSGYQDGNFYLLLSPPVFGGEYSCHIPGHFLPHLCAGNGSIQGNTSEKVNASFILDSIKVRLSLVEAENKRLNNELQTARDELNNELRTARDELEAENKRLNNELRTARDELAAENKRLTNELQTARDEHVADMKIMAAKDQELKADLKSMDGSSFIRWGRKSCPNNTSLVYVGVAGGKQYNQKGSGTNRLCLTRTPEFDNTTKPPAYGTVFGAEYQNIPGHTDHDVPCSVCLAPQSTTVMVPATKTCPPGWTPQYSGHLASQYTDHYATEYVCLDGSPEHDSSSTSNDNGHLFYYTFTVCGSLPCPPYQNDKIVTCVVCSK